MWLIKICIINALHELLNRTNYGQICCLRRFKNPLTLYKSHFAHTHTNTHSLHLGTPLAASGARRKSRRTFNITIVYYVQSNEKKNITGFRPIRKSKVVALGIVCNDEARKKCMIRWHVGIAQVKIETLYGSYWLGDIRKFWKICHEICYFSNAYSQGKTVFMYSPYPHCVALK